MTVILPGNVHPGDYVHVTVTQLRPMSTATRGVGIVTLELVDDENYENPED